MVLYTLFLVIIIFVLRLLWDLPAFAINLMNDWLDMEIELSWKTRLGFWAVVCYGCWQIYEDKK